MRILAILLFAVVFAQPVFAAKRVTVERLEQFLTETHGMPDAKLARQLSDLELTERLSETKLLHWYSELSGQMSGQALIALADASAFLNPPAAEMAAMAEPDVAAQRQMMTMVLNYVNQTMHQLPNFFATRDTISFEDTPSTPATFTSGQETGLSPIAPTDVGGEHGYEPLHAVSNTSATVLYRDGIEVLDTGEAEGKKAELPAKGLATSGEFGLELGIVIVDAIHGKLAWSHWEQGVAGPWAVFHYSVPQAASHYSVMYSDPAGDVQQVPGYHGEIAVDPTSGAVWRLTVVAELKSNELTSVSNRMVEYGPVTIGGTTYVCPMKAVALSKVELTTVMGRFRKRLGMQQTKLNDISFTQYHLFRAETRVLTGENEEPAGSPSASGGITAPASPQTQSSSAATSPSAPTSSSKAAPTPEGTVPSTDSTAPEQDQVPSVAAVEPVPALSASKSEPASAETVLHLTTSLVLVDAVVTDKGEAVHKLDRGRFHVLEDEQEQTIRTFDEHQPALAPAGAPSPAALPSSTYSNTPVYPESSALNVLLLDALNTPATDQAKVRHKMLEYLGSIPPGTSLAVFTLSSRLRMVSGFTTNVAELANALERKQPNTVVNSEMDKAGQQQVEDAAADAAGSGFAVDAGMVSGMQRLQGDATAVHAGLRGQMTLDALQQLARYLSAVPGRKNLIWLSGSFPIALYPTNPAGPNSSPKRTDSVRVTCDLLSAARVAVYPVDASGLMPAPLPETASEDYSVANSTVTQAVDNNLGFEAQIADNRESMRQIAEATGGQAYVSSNGLKEAVASTIQNGGSYYTLGYAPVKKPDGRFRKIKLRLDNARYSLAYRRGYYADFDDKPSAHNPSQDSPVLAASQLGAPPSTQILFQARVLPASDPLFKGTALPAGPVGEMASTLKGPGQLTIVDLAVAPHSLLFEDAPDGGRRAEIEFAVLAYDADGKRSNYLDRGIQVNLKPEQYARIIATNAPIPYRMALDLPKGPISLRIVVYDHSAATVGSLELPIATAAK
jgi:VWFA-related protein